jgi:hypothetical protein
MHGLAPEQIEPFLNPGLKAPADERAFFVQFRNGSHRFVAPDPHDPMKFRVQASPEQGLFTLTTFDSSLLEVVG